MGAFAIVMAIVAGIVAFGDVPAAIDSWDEFLIRRFGANYADAAHRFALAIEPIWIRIAAFATLVLITYFYGRTLRRWGRVFTKFWWSFMVEEQWLSRNSALGLIADSDWLEVRSPYSGTRPHFMRRLTNHSGMASTQEVGSTQAFARYALKAFAQQNPEYARGIGRNIEVRRDKLEEWLDQQLEDFVTEKFGGAIPQVFV